MERERAPSWTLYFQSRGKKGRRSIGVSLLFSSVIFIWGFRLVVRVLLWLVRAAWQFFQFFLVSTKWWCMLQNSSCLIGGRCFSANDLNPKNPAVFCNPSVNTTDWSSGESQLIAPIICFTLLHEKTQSQLQVLDYGADSVKWTAQSRSTAIFHFQGDSKQCLTNLWISDENEDHNSRLCVVL